MKVYLGVLLLLATFGSAMATWPETATLNFVVPNNDFSDWNLTYVQNHWSKNVDLAKTVNLIGLNPTQRNSMWICKSSDCTGDIEIKDNATYTVSTKEEKCTKDKGSATEKCTTNPTYPEGTCPAGYVENGELCLK